MSDAERMVGAVLSGRYRLVKLIGEGGMGAVFLATNVDRTATCAVKVLAEELRADEGVRARFFSEAEAAMRLSHAGVVRTYEAGRAEDGTPYIVMELVDGVSLSALAPPGKPLSVARGAALIHGVLEALAWAHAAGIVHRDLKPENVLVTTTNGVERTQLLDFGIARVMDAAGGQGKRTRTGMLLGTPGYMSPEQITRPHEVDGRADLFSVGVMLYELLSGGSAWPAETPFEKIAQIVALDARPISTFSPALAPLDAFFARALARAPGDRFASAAEMAKALAAAAASVGAVTAPTIAGADPRVEPATQASEARPADVPAPRPEVAPGQVQIVVLPPRRRWLVPVAIFGACFLVAAIVVVALVAHGAP